MAARVACFWRALCYADCDASGIGVGGRQSSRARSRLYSPEEAVEALKRMEWKSAKPLLQQAMKTYLI